MSYSLLKSLHLLGVALFIGNILVTAFWKTLADRTRKAEIIAFSQRMVTLCDVLFTALGAALIVGCGLLMAGSHATVFATTWLSWGYMLFMASGLLWLFVLIPIQLKQSRLVKAIPPGAEVPGEYWRLARAWAIFGTLATLLPLANLYFMVFKPL